MATKLVKMDTSSSSVEEVTRYSTDDNTDSEDDSLRDRLSDADFPISDDDYCEKKESDEEVGKTSGAGGWANSIAKVLKTNAVKDQKSIVLSKAKKQDEIEKKKEKKAYDFQIDGADTNEDIKPDDDELELEILKNRYKQRIADRLKIFNLRMKPSYSDLDRERTFRKIGTKGVVQLFNAVKGQQSEITRRLGTTKLESKREEIIKSQNNKKEFLNALMSGPRSKSELIDQPVKSERGHKFLKEESSDDESAKESTWSALKDNFMTGKKVGWDKDNDEEDDEDGEVYNSDLDESDDSD